MKDALLVMIIITTFALMIIAIGNDQTITAAIAGLLFGAHMSRLVFEEPKSPTQESPDPKQK